MWVIKVAILFLMLVSETTTTILGFNDALNIMLSRML